jgi:hypothetical protein
MSGKFMIPLLTGVFLVAPAFVPATRASLSDSALAQKTTPATNSSNLNLSKSNVNRTASTPTTGANTSDRAVTFGRDKLKGTTKTQGDFNQGNKTKNSGHATERAINLNSSKSN